MSRILFVLLRYEALTNLQDPKKTHGWQSLYDLRTSTNHEEYPNLLKLRTDLHNCLYCCQQGTQILQLQCVQVPRISHVAFADW